MKYRSKHQYGRCRHRNAVKRPGRPAKSQVVIPEQVLEAVTAVPVSASRRKLGFFSAEKATPPQPTNAAGGSFYILAHFDQLKGLVGQLACPQCHGHVSLTTEDARKGFALKMVVTCGCGYSVAAFTSPLIPEDANPTRQPYEINRSIVLAGREVGLGHREVTKMMAVLNVNGGLHHKTYNTINSRIMNSLLYGPAIDVLSDSHSVVHRIYDDLYGPTDGPRNITVSYDGTWHTRGHSSNLGACFVIECLTGLVLDYVVLSKYCSECELVGDKMQGEEHKMWLEAHQGSCDRNHHGSSGAMETEGAKMLWSRSLDVGNFAYTSLVGDGDAAVLDTLHTLAPYPDEQVSKEECINHISKRMFKGLERVVKETDSQVKENRKSAAGLLTKMSGRGRMTKERMKKWSSYYRKAIVENAPNVEAARNAVWAIFFHSLSTVDDPHHTFCSPDWCWYKQALRDRKDPKKAQAGHDPPLPKDISERLIPLFERLADRQLLARCMTLQTSNANEAIHSTIWKRAPKHKNCGRKTLETSVALAVMQYNKGASSLMDVVDSLGIQAGEILAKTTAKLDKDRVHRADKAALKESKTQRKKNVLTKIRQEETLQAQEGKLYEAGGH